MSELNITIPERGAVTPVESAPVAVKTDKTADAPPPEARTADGTPADAPPAPDKASAENEPTPGELARKERNRQRWQAMKSERSQALSEVARLRAENERLRKPVDYSQIQDPDEALAARTAAKVRESMAGDTDAAIARNQDTAERALIEAWQTIVEDGRARAPDWDQVVTDATPIHQRMAPFLIESDKGGDIAYWLGKNPQAASDLFQKFEKNPAVALIELGRIEARLGAPSSKPVSTAPRPAPVLAGGSSPPSFDQNHASVSDMASQLRKAGIIR